MPPKKPAHLGGPAGLAAALAAGPVNPAARRQQQQQQQREEEAAAAAAAASAQGSTTPRDQPETPRRLFGRKPAPPKPVGPKPTKTREITYKVGNGESVLGVAVESNDEHTRALTHPTKERARGPAGRKGGARRPPSHKPYTLNDPTAQLQPTML